MQPAPATISGIGAEYLRGITAERVILLDAERMLGDEKIIVQHGLEESGVNVARREEQLAAD